MTRQELNLTRHISSKAMILGCYLSLVIGCTVTKPNPAGGQTYTLSRAADLTNEAVGRVPTENQVVNAADYYNSRVDAIRLVREESWAKARLILEELTAQYQDDGDTWYLLGLGYLQAQRWPEAILALENALELGTTLVGIPTGSFPANDIMMQVAEAYSRSGDESAALRWIDRALDARYDERPRLAGTHPFLGMNENFSAIETSEAYRRAAGSYLPESLSRDQAWRHDLGFLKKEMMRLHVNLHHQTTSQVFEEKLKDIEKKIPNLADHQIVFAFMQLLGLAGNGHNFLIPAFGAKGAFDQLPMQFYWFSDGLYVVDARDEYRQWVGARVTHFGTTPTDAALNLIQSINPRDNEMQQRWLAPYYLSMPAALEGLNIIDNSPIISLTLESPRSGASKVEIGSRELTFQGFPTLPSQSTAAAKPPGYLDRQAENYWYEQIPDIKALFVQFNRVQNMESISLRDFSLLLRKQIVESEIDNFILDLRHNSGGDGSLLAPIIATITAFEALKPDGKLFVIFGRSTFSAGHSTLVDINRLTNAILVGEPSGSRPNAMGEAGWFQLPYSGITGIVSSQYHQDGAAEDHRIWVAPQVPIIISSRDYFSGKDSAVEAIAQIIEGEQ